MKKLFWIGMAALFLTVVQAGAAELKWTGCGISKKAFMKELSRVYEQNTGVRVIIRGGGATKGIRAVAKGEADLGGTCRHKIDVPEEKAAVLHQVAWDALVVVVNENSPVDGITLDQVKKIFTGKIKNWKDLGGTDAPLKLFVRRGKISGVGLMMREIVFHNPDQDFSPDAEVKKSSGPIEAAISKDPLAIGATGISSAKKRKHLKMLKIDGVAPTKENIASGKYPLYRPLYLVTRENPAGEVKNFLDFALSPAGQSLIAAQGTVNIEEGKGLSVR